MKNVDPKSIDKLYFDALAAELKAIEACHAVSEAFQAIEYHPAQYSEETPDEECFDTADIEISARSAAMSGLEGIVSMLNNQVMLLRSARVVCAARHPYLLERHEG